MEEEIQQNTIEWLIQECWSFNIFWHSIVLTFPTILVSELFDKKGNCTAVLIGSNIAFCAMVGLTCALGYCCRFFFSESVIIYFSVVVFIGYGIQLIYDAYHNKDNEWSGLNMAVADLNLEISNENSEEEHDNELQQFLLANVSRPLPFFTLLAKAFTQLIFDERGNKIQVFVIGLAAYFDPLGVYCGSIFTFFYISLLSISCGRKLSDKFNAKVYWFIMGFVFILIGLYLLISKRPEQINKQVEEAPVLAQINSMLFFIQ